MDNNDNYEAARIAARLDQAEGGMREVAALVASYYKALRENGVDVYTAAQLTLHYQNQLFTWRKRA